MSDTDYSIYLESPEGAKFRIFQEFYSDWDSPAWMVDMYRPLPKGDDDNWIPPFSVWVLVVDTYEEARAFVVFALTPGAQPPAGCGWWLDELTELKLKIGA